MSLTSPHRISPKIDITLDYLNASWDLQLPRLYGTEARPVIDDRSTVSRRCSLRIRFLCYRSETAVDNCIAKFAETATSIRSQWIHQSVHAAANLSSTVNDGSFLKRDSISREPNESRVREMLVLALAGILETAYMKEQDLGSGDRAASRSFDDRITTRPRTPSPKGRIVQGDGQSNTIVTPSKRRKKSEDDWDEHRKRLQAGGSSKKADRKINEFFTKSKRPGEVSAEATHPTKESNVAFGASRDDIEICTSQQATTSFETTISHETNIFSVADSRSTNSSCEVAAEHAGSDESQDYFPTQDANLYLADESFTSELSSADSAILQTFSFANIKDATPFHPRPCLPFNTPFWLLWEVHRVEQVTNIPQTSIIAALTTEKAQDRITYVQFWKTVGIVCKEHNKTLPPISEAGQLLVQIASSGYTGDYTASFTFQLEFCQKPGPSLWKLVLHPIKIEKGNRIHRRFGADRHVIGFLQFYDKQSMPKWVTQRRDYNATDAYQTITRWLTTSVHHIAGRNWRTFFIEPKKKRLGEPPLLKLNMFAVGGVGIKVSQSNLASDETVSIEDFINWHTPIDQNLNSTDLKLFSRFGLALSKTVSSVKLEPHQFRYLEDVEPVMNDGCALMSIPLAKAIWNVCGDGSSDVPSAFQGRVGGAKGLWIVDYRDRDLSSDANDLWIQVSDSQLKIKPHPRDHHNADETQRTFEVLKWSTRCTPGHLNIQLINILDDRGVPRPVLRQAVLDDIEEYIEASRGAMKEPKLLLAWLTKYHGIARERPKSSPTSYPEKKECELRSLVLSGFSAENCLYLRQGVISLMKMRLMTYVEKLRIEIAHSTTVFCAPDPYQILEEDEIYLGFSDAWENPRTGLKEHGVSNMDVLVARTPAALPSDIQKRKAVYKHELRHFKDIVIFPTKGNVPLASLLSGGDYDGDTVTIIWDPKLVDDFRQVQKPELPTEEQCGLAKQSKKMSNYVNDPLVAGHVIDEFLVSSFLFNAQQNRLGFCTTEHDMLVYSGIKLSDPGAVLLATLAGYLVDANKQGLYQSDEAWYKLRKAALAGRKTYPLAYKNGQDTPRRRNNGECVNIIDYLKTDVAMVRKDDVLREFENMLPSAQNYDRDLSFLYNSETQRSQDQNEPTCEAIRQILANLKERLTAVQREWSRRVGKREHELDKGDIATDIRHIRAMVEDIEPLAVECDIYQDFVREGEYRSSSTTSLPPSNKRSRWALLRASAMYASFHRGNLAFWTVGDELAKIKARSYGDTREMVPHMLDLLKADAKYIRKITGKEVCDNDKGDDEGEEEGNEDEDEVG